MIGRGWLIFILWFSVWWVWVYLVFLWLALFGVIVLLRLLLWLCIVGLDFGLFWVDGCFVFPVIWVVGLAVWFGVGWLWLGLLLPVEFGFV